MDQLQEVCGRPLVCQVLEGSRHASTSRNGGLTGKSYGEMVDYPARITETPWPFQRVKLQ